MSKAVTLASVMAQEPDLGRGGELYATCQACHQENGSGVKDGSVPHIAGQHYGYVAAQLVNFRLQYRGNERMQHFVAGNTFSNPQAIADVAAYVAALQPAPRPAAATVTASKRGARLFSEICSQCHSNDGQGNATLGVPRIAGQYPAYLARRIRAIMMRDEHYSNVLVPMLVDELSDEDIEAVAGYVASLITPVPARETPRE
ncbi:MAG: c-type cytochrome [Pseudomonadota bacterium]